MFSISEKYHSCQCMLSKKVENFFITAVQDPQTHGSLDSWHYLNKFWIFTRFKHQKVVPIVNKINDIFFKT